MNFASRVILAGRSFVSYLLKLAASVKEMYYFVHLNKLCREDIYVGIISGKLEWSIIILREKLYYIS